MPNMKLFSRRVVVIYTSVVVTSIACMGVLNSLIWSYRPDNSFETLETFLWPFVRPVLSLITLAIFVTIAFDHHTVRVIRKLSYFNDK